MEIFIGKPKGIKTYAIGFDENGDMLPHDTTTKQFPGMEIYFKITGKDENGVLTFENPDTTTFKSPRWIEYIKTYKSAIDGVLYDVFDIGEITDDMLSNGEHFAIPMYLTNMIGEGDRVIFMDGEFQPEGEDVSAFDIMSKSLFVHNNDSEGEFVTYATYYEKFAKSFADDVYVMIKNGKTLQEASESLLTFVNLHQQKSHAAIQYVTTDNEGKKNTHIKTLDDAKSRFSLVDFPFHTSRNTCSDVSRWLWLKLCLELNECVSNIREDMWNEICKPTFDLRSKDEGMTVLLHGVAFAEKRNRCPNEDPVLSLTQSKWLAEDSIRRFSCGGE